MQRLNIQLDLDVYDRLCALGFQTRTPVAEIIRDCVNASIDKVEAKLVAGCAGKLAMDPTYYQKLTGMAEAERSSLSKPSTEKKKS